MCKKDLLWIFALPIYYLVNSFRHEVAHAISAVLEGARLLALTFWPAVTATGEVINRNGAAWEGEVSWLTSAMPYFFDLLTFVVLFYFVMAVPFQQRWVWVNLIIIGLISPLANSASAYLFLGEDMRALMQVFPAGVVDLYFLATLTFYIVGLLLALTFSRTAMPSLPQPAAE